MKEAGVYTSSIKHPAATHLPHLSLGTGQVTEKRHSSLLQIH